MDIKDIVCMEHGISLPISGGYGDKIETAVVIDASARLNFIDVQNAYIGCWWDRRKWRKVEQCLMNIGGKKYDKITIKYVDVSIEKLMDYYFDVSESIIGSKR